MSYRRKKKSLYRKVQSLEKKVNLVSKAIEEKFVDYELSNQLVTAGVAGSELNPVSIGCLNGVGEGDGDGQRTGRELLIKSLEIRGVLKGPVITQAAIPSPRVVTLALVLDKQTNGAQLNSEDVYTPENNILCGPFKFRERYNTKRFRVLRRLTVKLDFNNLAWDGTGNNASPSSRVINLYHKFKRGLKVIYEGTGSTVANIKDNSLHLIGWSDIGTPTITYASRLRFLDA